MEISNSGWEFINVLNKVARDWERQKARKRWAHDRHMWHDHVQRHNTAFPKQMPAMVEAFMLWDSSHGPDGLDNLEEWKEEEEVLQRHTISVVDLFCEFALYMPLYCC